MPLQMRMPFQGKEQERKLLVVIGFILGSYGVCGPLCEKIARFMEKFFQKRHGMQLYQ